MRSVEQKKLVAEYNKEYRKKYNQENKNKISESGKIYYQKNKDEILKTGHEYHKTNIDQIHAHHGKYYETNRTKILDSRKIYYINNKDKIKRYIDNNREKVATSLRNYKVENKKEIASWTKEYSKKPERIFKVYEYSAKARNIEFKLTFEEFTSFWQKPCHYCTDPIETIGLDRVDNSKGYLIENVVACCKICNKMKMDLSLEKFITKITNIINNNAKK